MGSSETYYDISKLREDTSVTWPIILSEAEIDAEPIAVYVPSSEETPIGPTIGTDIISAEGNVSEKEKASAVADTPMEGFFDGLILLQRPWPLPLLLLLGRILEVYCSISAKFSTPPKGGVPQMGAQIEEVLFTTPPPVISPSNPFAVLPQVVRGEPSLVVTPSSISSSTTQMLDMELSPEVGSEEILDDSDDELAVKTRISDSNNTSNEEFATEVMGISSPPLRI
nr:hypothetical protein CFP56_27575 [Quercus suber]